MTLATSDDDGILFLVASEVPGNGKEQVNVNLCIDCHVSHDMGYDANPDGAGWLVGESDTVTLDEPLTRLQGSLHLLTECDDEASFSWSHCDGCGSSLGGDRVRYILRD